MTAKANVVPRAMNQRIPVPGTGTSCDPFPIQDLTEEEFVDSTESPLQTPLHSGPTSSTCAGHESSANSLRTHVANLRGVRGKGTSSRPAKKSKVDRGLTGALDRLTESNMRIEERRIESNWLIVKRIGL